uniref:Uncharacterized protein n=1 Tax=Sander lucioperca TaxID=283035 RepID=A0A8D0AQM0_SANLU
MDIDALLEAFQDFEKKGKKETCPELEQFLCHVAKTGQPIAPHNPNVDYIPFEEMKSRILKIVDGYNG